MNRGALAVLLVLGVGAPGGGGAFAAAAPPSGAPSRPALAESAAPGLTVTPLDPHVRRFHLAFRKGDDILGGLAAFARKARLTDASFTAVGAMDDALIGRYDPANESFKTTRLHEEMEIASLTGSITRGAGGNPVVHVHCVVALLRNGAVYAGHLLRGRVSLTLQLYLTDARPLPAPPP